MIPRSFSGPDSSWISDTGLMMNKTMRNKTGLVTLSLLCSALFATGAFAADSMGEPGRSEDGKNPLKNVYTPTNGSTARPR